MKVTLISHTPDPAELCALAAQTCYSGATIEERIKGGKILTPEGVKNMMDRVIRSGHHSTIEHASFTFAIEGVSRALTHQLVRHRVGASFSQQSQRYVKMNKATYVTPPSIAKSPSDQMYDEFMAFAWRVYDSLIREGIHPEDARYVLPNACTTNIIMTMNGRELMHFLALRSCNRTQWELREVAWEIYRQLQEVAPEIFNHSGPPCWFGPCREDKPCGNPPQKYAVE